ncbi:MAG: class I SAM-dependent methyltransferase [Rhodospirillales bacterium]|nr:class I SAM-dependent methyltransferase [Rhodospirillales bacterium]
MTGFSADWLALRAPADAAARSRALARMFARALRPGAHVADLGAGRGALTGWLGKFLPKGTRWTLVDGDARLLSLALHGRKRRMSLGGRLPEADAYVSTALIDLTGPAWLRHLVRHARGRPMLMHLAVDGRHEFSIPHPLDEAVLTAFARHQRRFKGLGPALGGEAPFAFATMARRAGYRVALARSDWSLREPALLLATVEGIARAAAEQQPFLDAAAWLHARSRQIADGKLNLVVGHRDVLAIRHRRRPTVRPA